MCFEDTLRATDWTEIIEAMDNSESLLTSLYNKDGAAVAQSIEKCHRENTSILKYNDENSLAMVLNLAFYCARRDYMVVREMPAGNGFADLVCIPKKNVDKPAIVLELKWNKGAKTAIDQISTKHYPDSLKGYEGEILLAAISYDKDSNSHECIIESIHV